MRPIALFILLLALSASPAFSQAEGGNRWWPQWRGPDMTGVAENASPPIRWSEEENVRWKVAIPGEGDSTPIVWKDRIYLCTAIRTEEAVKTTAPEPEPEPPSSGPGRRPGRRGMNRATPTHVYEFAVLALDRKDGSPLWKTTVAREVPHEAGHPTGSYASNSPVTDGERIYAFFGSRGVHCLDMNGKVLWSKDLGDMKTRMQFGEGASPALHDGVLVIAWDDETDEDFIVALDARSGEELWRRKRDEPTGWTTPLIVEVAGKAQVIVPATNASRGYDLKSGEPLWQLSGMTANSIPTPVHGDGVVYLMSGYRGNALQAVRLAGARGDLAGSEALLWTYTERGTSYVPSALLYGGKLYFLSTNSGILTCLDARTGKVLYDRQRLEGVRDVYASPVGAAGRVYITSRDGVTKVIRLGDEYAELATNALDDEIDASAVIVGDQIYLRGSKHLYCIGEKAGEGD